MIKPATLSALSSAALLLSVLAGCASGDDTVSVATPIYPSGAALHVDRQSRVDSAGPRTLGASRANPEALSGLLLLLAMRGNFAPKWETAGPHPRTRVVATAAPCDARRAVRTALPHELHLRPAHHEACAAPG